MHTYDHIHAHSYAERGRIPLIHHVGYRAYVIDGQIHKVQQYKKGPTAICLDVSPNIFLPSQIVKNQRKTLIWNGN